MSRIAFIGGGNMSRAIIGGLVASGFDAASIAVSEPDDNVRRSLSDDFPGASVVASNLDAVDGADTIVLAVKPQVLPAVCAEIRDAVQSARPLVLSIAAGINTQTIDGLLGGGIPAVRIMPNQPALLGHGMSGVYANAECSDADRRRASELAAATGEVLTVERESDIDTVTAISGSGPAYFYLLIDMLIDYGISRGLLRDAARQLAAQTATGAAAIVQASDDPVAELIARVRSPKGTTEAALDSLEDGGIRTIVAAALEAARQRAEVLAADAEKSLGEN